MFHIGLFLGCGVQSWNGTWSGAGATEWLRPDVYIDTARALERARFDCMVFEDASFIPDIYGGTAEYALAKALLAPKQDPLAMVPVIARATERIGLVPTVTTTFHPPYMAARLMSTLDHLSRGRIGANLVMSHNDRTAQNYGQAGQDDHDLRYTKGDEWVRLVTALWDSWEPGAMVLDRERGVFADHTKVHTVDFEGEFFSCRGPLNTMPGPQGRPVICQAGGSPAGREFAARHAEIILCNVRGIEGMKEYRKDITERMIANGRKPSDCKVMNIVTPVLGETDEEARAKAGRLEAAAEATVHANLAMLSYYSGIDFSRFDLDAPMPDLATNASRSTTRHLRAGSTGQTLREFASAPAYGTLRFVGSPDTVAAQMQEAIAEVDGDGFLLHLPAERRAISEVADGLAPALQRRGAMRKEYTHEHFRDNLLEF